MIVFIMPTFTSILLPILGHNYNHQMTTYKLWNEPMMTWCHLIMKDNTKNDRMLWVHMHPLHKYRKLNIVTYSVVELYTIEHNPFDVSTGKKIKLSHLIVRYCSLQSLSWSNHYYWWVIMMSVLFVLLLGKWIISQINGRTVNATW